MDNCWGSHFTSTEPIAGSEEQPTSRPRYHLILAVSARQKREGSSELSARHRALEPGGSRRQTISLESIEAPVPLSRAVDDCLNLIRGLRVASVQPFPQ